MVYDYEAAWGELQALVASKTQHGREGLLTAMAEIVARNRVPAGELARMLRLYGVEVERARSITAEIDRDVLDRFGGGLASPQDDAAPRTSSAEGGHDGSSSSRVEAAATV